MPKKKKNQKAEEKMKVPAQTDQVDQVENKTEATSSNTRNSSKGSRRSNRRSNDLDPTVPRLMVLGGLEFAVSQGAALLMNGKEWTVEEASSENLKLTWSWSEDQDVKFRETKEKIRTELNQRRVDLKRSEKLKDSLLLQLEEEDADRDRLIPKFGTAAHTGIHHTARKRHKLAFLPFVVLLRCTSHSVYLHSYVCVCSSHR